MKKLLHIIATPRAGESMTLKVSETFLDSFKKKYPDSKIDTLDITREKLPPLTVKAVNGKYVLLGGGNLTGELKLVWGDIVKHIERFLSADGYLLSVPMWNFSVPYYLKHYIDVIVQPRYLFRYTENGPEGLVKNKKMVIITSRGGDYGPDSPERSYDNQEPYLRTVFGFVGLTDITFINAQPMNALGLEVEKQKIEEAQALAVQLGQGFF